MPRRLLIVDDDPSVVEYLVESFQELGFAVLGTTSARDALERLVTEDFDVLVSDVVMPELRGLDLLAAAHRVRPGVRIILITAFGSIDLAVEALRAGAADFVTKPFEFDTLLGAVERAMLGGGEERGNSLRPLSAGDEEDLADGVVARSPGMQRAVEIAKRAGQTTSAVLITGESGVGKGVLARLIHQHSQRANGPFVQVNCASLPLALVEAELFGVRRGAYTDAKETRKGLFVEAEGGTLFLDEVGELPTESQPKLLQALETSRIRPVGSVTDAKVDVRVIAATNAPLEDALKERRFRPDLYYRLNVIRIEIPPLRERREDIIPLARRLLSHHARQTGKPGMTLTDEALAQLERHGWPGNVRELSNVLERTVALSDREQIGATDLSHVLFSESRFDFLTEAVQRGLSLEELETAYIRRVLESMGGNVQRAANVLGVDRRTVYRKLRDV